MSKGSKARPLSVSKETFADNYERIFGKKEDKPVKTQNSSISGAVTGPSFARRGETMTRFSVDEALFPLGKECGEINPNANPLSEEAARRNAEADAENANFDISVMDTWTD